MQVQQCTSRKTERHKEGDAFHVREYLGFEQRLNHSTKYLVATMDAVFGIVNDGRPQPRILKL